MTDLFVSYSSEDRPYVEELVTEFESQGWTVWWDRRIETGATFDTQIEKAIDDSLCIVVVWSDTSVRSEWVRAEAAEGLERNVLVPILLDDVKPPLLFRQKQAISLVDWKHNRGSSSPPLKSLIPSIASILSSYRESSLPISTQRAWALGDVENATGNRALDGVVYTALDIGLSYFDDLFVYTDKSRDLVSHQLEDLVHDEGLDGFLCGEMVGGDGNLSITLHIVESGQARSSRTFVVETINSITSCVATYLVEIAEQLQGIVPLQSDAMTAYVSSLEVEALHAFWHSHKLARGNDYEKVKTLCRQATQLNPNFAAAWRGWAIACVYLGQQEEARDVIAKAVRSMEGVSERTRLFTRGIYYALHSEDYGKAAAEFRALLNASPMEEAAINNLAVCTFNELDFPTARELSARDLQLHPTKVVGFQNAACYSLYAGSFDEAEQLAGKVLGHESTVTHSDSIVIRALVAAERGQLSHARERCTSYLGHSDRTDSTVLQGLADLAMAEQDWVLADKLLKDGLKIDDAIDDYEHRARKLLMSAEVELCSSGEDATAQRLMSEAIVVSDSTPTLITAAVLCLQHRIEDTAPLLGKLRRKVSAHGRAYTRTLEAVESYHCDDLGKATSLLGEALSICDLWLVRWCSALIYHGSNLELEAQDEFAVCASRPGEGLSATLDEHPTYRYLAAVRKMVGSPSNF